MRAFAITLFVILVAFAAGALGFWAGAATNVVTDASGPAPAVVWYGYPHFFGAGFLLFILFVGLLLAAFAGRRRWGPPGHWGPGYWTREGDPRRQWIADAHRRLHEEEARAAGATGAPGSGTATDGDTIPGGPPAP